MANSYIKLFHKILTWGWYGDTNTVRVFLHILLRANYKDSEYKGHTIPAGSCVFGRKKWAKELELSEQQIRTAISHLQSTNEITIKSTNKFSIVHVEKWEFWQIEEGNQPTNQPTTNHLANQQVTTSKEYKNTNTTPTIEEVREYVKEKGLMIDADYFYEYYTTAEWKDVKGKPVKNWKLKALNWNRRETNDIGRSNAKRTGVCADTRTGENETSDNRKTVRKRFKTMEDVLQDNERCEGNA